VGFGHTGLTFPQTPECFTEVVKGTVPLTFLQRSQEKLMSIRTTAKSIGNKDASTAELAVIIRKAYAKAKPDVQAEIRADFHIGYIAGRDRLSISDAAAVWQAGKGEGAINAPAIARAVAAWKYYVTDHLPKADAAPAKHMRISSEARALAMDFLGNFEGKNRTEQIKQAIALLNALK
jgi:hypothetical protein